MNSPDKSFIERRAIDFVPESERHGSVFNQFTLWLGNTFNVTACVIGALAVATHGSLAWSIIGLLAGQVVGAAILALHAIQGPKLGLPQMITTRAQFGRKGTLIPVALVCLMCVGLSATGTILAGQTVSALFGINENNSIILFSVLVLVLTVIGYDLIHKVAKIAGCLGFIAFAYMFIALFHKNDVSNIFTSFNFNISEFLLASSLAASWQLSFCPYVADYSRYLAPDTNSKKIFLSTFLGSTIGTQISMTFGVIAATLAGSNFSGHEMAYIVGLGSAGSIGMLLYLAILIGKITGIGLNTYTSSMCFVTLFDKANGSDSKTRQRQIFSVISILLSTIVSLWASNSFLTHLSSFILIILTFLTPWSAINLIEFYTDKNNYNYQVQQLLHKDSIYTGINWFTLVLYIVSIFVQVPFISTNIYTGSIAHYLKGTDVSWFIGLLFPALILSIAKLFAYTNKQKHMDR